MPAHCKEPLSGKCSKPTGKCDRPHVEKKDLPCPFLAKGGCAKGSACDWGH